eukprot:s4446_g4.t1
MPGKRKRSPLRQSSNASKTTPKACAKPPVVEKIYDCARSWKQRLGLWQKPKPGQPVTLASDCSGYGSELVALRLLGLQGRIKPVMACDHCKAKRALHKTVSDVCGFNDADCIYFTDVFERDHKDAPRADLYCAGFPCPPFSRIGKREGCRDQRGLATLEGLHYLAAQRPRAVLLEQVSAIRDKNHKQLWQFIVKVFQLLEYQMVHGIVSTRYFGIPQSRPRLYILAICKEAVSKGKSLTMPEPRAKHPDLHTFLQKSLSGTEKLDLPNYEKRLGPKMWNQGYVLDVQASAKFQSILHNCCPCLTKTRCKQHGYYIPKLLRRLNDVEMAKLQGLPAAVTEAMMAAAQGLPAGSFGAAVGDAMSINVLQTMLRHLCNAAGLFDLPERYDFWRQCPEDRCHQLSDSLWAKYDK